jgi:general secretion pathway protein J
MNRIAREISMSFLSEHYDRKRFRERPTRFVLKDGRREADVTFTSFGNERLAIDAKESDQALFEYKLGNDPEVSGRRNLYRRVKPILDEDPDRGGQTAVLAEDVVAFSLEGWDPRDRAWRAEWDSNSPSQNAQFLVPPRVRISLTIKDEQGKEKIYTTQASIMLSQPLDF